MILGGSVPILLNVQSSPNFHSSGSRAVSKAFVEAFAAKHPDFEVIDVDLVKDPPKHVGREHLRAFFMPPETHEPDDAAALEASDAYVEQLISADVIVLGTPMHNLGISSTMKSWIDNIIRVGKTFRYTENGPIGLIPGKKVVIVVGGGGIYTSGPLKNMEHAGNYLRDILSTLGVTDITILRAEGLALGPGMLEQGVANGEASARSTAEALYSSAA
jgi:FMN-dependent NADH-azoreductase